MALLKWMVTIISSDWMEHVRSARIGWRRLRWSRLSGKMVGVSHLFSFGGGWVDAFGHFGGFWPRFGPFKGILAGVVGIYQRHLLYGGRQSLTTFECLQNACSNKDCDSASALEVWSYTPACLTAFRRLLRRQEDKQLESATKLNVGSLSASRITGPAVATLQLSALLQPDGNCLGYSEVELPTWKYWSWFWGPGGWGGGVGREWWRKSCDAWWLGFWSFLRNCGRSDNWGPWFGAWVPQRRPTDLYHAAHARIGFT